ncbi:MAG: ABC transporter substrate-binding protein [Burkholderiaceae bacterium]|nr:ABC transporter substrate-binding protein [Burkholderiaceae bacterium]
MKSTQQKGTWDAATVAAERRLSADEPAGRGSRRAVLKTLGGAALASPMIGARAQATVELDFYYPVAVGGAVTKTIDQLASDFEKDHPGIRVKPIYSGTYQESIVKAMTAAKSGKPPHIAVLLSTDMFSLIDEDAIVPIDTLAGSAQDRKWLEGFYDAFMMNSRTGGHVWGVPFQRSTIVLYWNKNLFKEAGLDPEKGPQDWAEMVEFARKLTKTDAGGNVSQWGVTIPSSGFPYWLFQGLTTPNDVILMNEAGNETYFDKPGAVEALQYWVDLSAKHKVMPGGVIEWGTTPKDFLEQKSAMIWTTTGNLTNIRNNSSFPFGVAMLPASKRRGSPTGGGNFYVFKQTSEAEKKASLAFMKWMTSPERAAQWSIATGYVAVRPDAWETEAMKKYVAEVPAALVARDQLEFSVAELSTHENQRVTKALNDALQAALTGAKQPGPALAEAQREATRILRRYRS